MVLRKRLILISVLCIISILMSALSIGCQRAPIDESQSSEQTSEQISQSDETTSYEDTTTPEETTSFETEATSTEQASDSEETTSDEESTQASDTTDEQSSESSQLHSYDNDCDEYCNECGSQREVPPHVYVSDCDTTCEVCDRARTAFGHKYNSDETCEMIFCTVCGHMEDQTHDYVLDPTVSVPATLLSSGYELYKCSKCGKDKNGSNKPLEQLTLADLNMPVVYINDFDGAAISVKDLQKADGEINVTFRYDSNSNTISDFSGTAKLKIQGATSAIFPKKNFTVKLYTDDTFEDKNKVDLGWGKQNKYCLKANWVDCSQARNIVGARMFAQLVASRTNINAGLNGAPNYGLIDGYPVIVYVNGEFHGLYTMNIPKDAWQFGMEGDDTTKEALLMADHWGSDERGYSTNLTEEIGTGSFEDHGWELEHCSTEDTDTTWVKDSMNELIRLLNCGDKEKIKAELHKHLDIEAAIDNMLFTYFIGAKDNTAKNILWATYDSKVWIPSMYDMDGTYGILWDGSVYTTYLGPSINSNGSFNIPGNKMYSVLIHCFPDEVEARWTYLRQNILTVDNTKAQFEAFFALTPDGAYDSDFEKWTAVPGQQTNRTNMYSAVAKQIERLDNFFYKFNK